MGKPYILISSCLLGLPTQWDNDSKRTDSLVELVKEGKAVFVCPEQIGGLTTPRKPSEIEHGMTAKDVLDGNARIINKEGLDVTKEFVEGAHIALDVCKKLEITIAILKSKSPSCGSQLTYDGTFTGTKIKGRGITAELLIQNGIDIYNEDNFPNNL